MSEADDSSQPTEGSPQPPSEEEIRARIEQQLRTVRVQDLLLESVVSVLNLAARRIAKEDERDLEQARVGIEAIRGLVDVLEEEAQREIRNALSQLQMLYAQQAGGAEPGAAPEGGAEPAPGAEQPGPATGAKPPPRLWTPGSD
jgi:hypothetical protein